MPNSFVFGFVEPTKSDIKIFWVLLNGSSNAREKITSKEETNRNLCNENLSHQPHAEVHRVVLHVEVVPVERHVQKVGHERHFRYGKEEVPRKKVIDQTSSSTAAGEGNPSKTQTPGKSVEGEEDYTLGWYKGYIVRVMWRRDKGGVMWSIDESNSGH